MSYERSMNHIISSDESMISNPSFYSSDEEAINNYPSNKAKAFKVRLWTGINEPFFEVQSRLQRKFAVVIGANARAHQLLERHPEGNSEKQACAIKWTNQFPSHHRADQFVSKLW